MSKEQFYNNLSSLNPIKKILNDANETLNDPEKVQFSDDVKEILGGALGGGLGIGLGGAGVIAAGSGAGAVAMTSGLATLGSLVGGGMMAGLFVVAAPAAVLGAGGVYFVSQRNKKALKIEKEALLQEIIRKQAAIQKAMHEKINEQESRLEHLASMLTLLKNAQNNLERDLEQEQAA
jgi:hypothetical protein